MGDVLMSHGYESWILYRHTLCFDACNRTVRSVGRRWDGDGWPPTGIDVRNVQNVITWLLVATACWAIKIQF